MELDKCALRDSDGINRLKLNLAHAAPIWKLNHFFVYGQSLATGHECWPAKSTDVRDDVLMVGDCVRPMNGQSVDFTPVGEKALKPMQAAVQNGFGSIVSPDVAARLKKGAANRGESPLEGALKFARMLSIQKDVTGYSHVAERNWFVGSNTAVGGRSIEELSKGSTPEFFNRNRDAARIVKDIATNAGASYGVVGLFYLQGEANYGSKGTGSKDEYERLLVRLRNDFNDDVVRGIAGQGKMPVIVTYQTGGEFARNDLSIAQAQLDVAVDQKGWFVAGPSYPVTSKGRHLDANGSRWLGFQLGKVWHRVAVLNRNWRPLSPLRASRRQRDVVVAFHVPCPPLQFQNIYAGHRPRMLPGRGFTLIDEGGVVPCEVTIAGQAIIKLVAARDFIGRVTLSYGRKALHNGAGNLCDSDPTVAPDPYIYRKGSGDYETADIPDLNDKPYPLWNWCVAFSMEV